MRRDDGMKIIVKTTKPAEMKELLEKSKAEITEKAKGLVDFGITELSENEFEIKIDYPMNNRLFNWTISNELKKTLKSFDEDVKFR